MVESRGAIEIVFFVFWIFLSILVGAYASSKNRSGGGWFFLSLIISPLIAFIIVAVSGIPARYFKKCPKCAEQVKAEAEICRFCGYDFTAKPESAPNSKSENRIEPAQPKEEVLQDRSEYLINEFNKFSKEIMVSTSVSRKAFLRKERDRVAKELNDLKKSIS